MTPPTPLTPSDRFGGIARLFGETGLRQLGRSRVLVVGVGGVGSWAAEALARSGVGTLGLVDLDDVCVSNTNRQLHALDGNFGRPKVDAMAERVQRIAPDCRVHPVRDFFTEATAATILDSGWDVVIDAIDHVGHKRALIGACIERGVTVLVSGGAGGRRDPSRVVVGDLARSGGDGLLRELRRQLRRERAMPDGDWGIRCVFSTEKPVFPAADGTVCATPDGPAPRRLDCRTGFGTASFVTGVFGLQLAGEAVLQLASTGGPAHG